MANLLPSRLQVRPAVPVSPGDIDLHPLRQLAVELATEAAGVVSEHHGRAAAVATKSSRTDLVTAIDRAAETLITSRLDDLRPDDGIVGEEGASRPATSGITWFIDPIDGTTNFVYGHPGYAVSVAAASGGRPIAGAVVDPLHGEVFSAALGAGAACNGEALAVTSTGDLRSALVATGFGYDAADRAHQGAVVAGLVGRVRDIRRMGSAALDLCSVAAGRGTPIRVPPLPWTRGGNPHRRRGRRGHPEPPAGGTGNSRFRPHRVRRSVGPRRGRNPRRTLDRA